MFLVPTRPDPVGIERAFRGMSKLVASPLIYLAVQYRWKPQLLPFHLGRQPGPKMSHLA